MNVLIVGAGAVGGFLADRLTNAGQDVAVLVRQRRADALRGGGLRVVDGDGERTSHPDVVTADELAERGETAQLIILAIKGDALDAALDDVSPAVGRGSIVLPFLNGMGHLDVLRDRFGAATIGGTLRVATELLEDDSIRVIAPVFQVELGAFTPDDDRADTVAERLRAAGAQVTISQDIVAAMWAKWLLIASVGAFTASMRAPVGDIVATPGGREIAGAILNEVVAIATAAGFPPESSVLEMTQSMLTMPGSPLTSSLSRDLVAGRATEVEPVLGDLVSRAEALGIDAPLVMQTTVMLRVHNHQVAGRSGPQTSSPASVPATTAA